MNKLLSSTRFLSLAASRDNPGSRAEMEAIGESDRMTLKFRKPE
ncbi:MAG: hypothetical protein OQK01_03555 [Xanthomonadales bacterium]|jgi:predicted methyltransferase|nr:hypothetical protein [Xanthomonadales bacterium]